DGAGRVVLVAGDGVGARLAGADAGQEQQVADPPGVGVGADRLGCPRRQRFAHADSVGYLMHTVFASVKNRSASSPPSRPTPLCFTPPKGVRRSRRSQQFTHTVPASIFSASRCARPRSRVHRDADRPYLTPLTIANNSSSRSNGVTVTTGPKISSWLTRQSGD